MTTAPRPAPTLRELQQWMAGQILDPDRLDACTPDAGDCRALIAAPACGTTADRLRVYAGGYPVRVQEALAESFPAVAHVVGDGAFANLVRRYIDATPLSSYNLNDAGAGLPGVLGADPLATTLPFLPDLARLEWQVARAFHAHEQETLDPRALANWGPEDWDGAVLRFQPWAALVTSDWPIREIWEARATPIAAIDIDLHHRPDRVLVRRSGYAVLCESVGEAEAEVLGALLGGQTLGSAVATLTARGSEPASVSAWFTRWTALRMITACCGAGQVIAAHEHGRRAR